MELLSRLSPFTGVSEMQTRPLGRSDLQVPVIAMGCWAIAGDSLWGPQDEQDAIEAIHAAMDAGANFYDTAEGYGAGQSERLLGRALRGRRDRAIIATKASPHHHTPEGLRAACEQSLQNLQTDWIDVYQLHWPNRDVPFAETWGAMQELIAEGKVRVGGVSNFGPRDLDELLASGHPDVNQLAYNLLFRAIEFEIQPLCVEQQISILCYSPLAQGLLTGKFATPDEVPAGRARTRHFSSQRELARHGESGAEAETFAAIAQIRAVAEELGVPMHHLALAWLLRQPGVACVLAGMRNRQQALDNIAAAELELPDEVVRRLSAVTEELKHKLGPNPDMWQGDSRIR